VRPHNPISDLLSMNTRLFGTAIFNAAVALPLSLPPLLALTEDDNFLDLKLIMR